MTAWGFCLRCQTDVPIGADRCCLNDGQLAIAPSWGDHTQTFRDGDWWPHRERTEGYVYRPAVAPLSQTRERESVGAEIDTPRRVTRRIAKARRSEAARERMCRGCGRAFTAGEKATRQVYCSPVCRRTRSQLDPRACLQCGVVFTPTQSTQVRCSQVCRERAKNDRQRLLTQERLGGERACVHCQTTFAPKQKTQTCCSVTCRQAFERRRERARRAASRAAAPVFPRFEPRFCQHCQREFSPTVHTARYCSDPCRRAGANRARGVSMAARGKGACVRCRRDDRPYGGVGRCHPCAVSESQKRQRQRRREGAAA